MSNAEALRRLAQEMIDAHEDRVVLKASIFYDLGQIKSETRECQKNTIDLIKTFASQHQDMARQLKSELGQFMSDLNAAESSRLAAAREDAGQRRDEIRRRVIAVDDLRKDVIDQLREITEAHQEMGVRLRAELDRFMSDLDAAESSRLAAAQEDAGQRQDEIRQRIAVVDDLRNDLVDQLREMAEAHQEMGKQLRADLDQFMSGLSQSESERKAVTQAYLSEVQADIRETAAAWKELIQRIQAARAGSPSVVTEAAETLPSFLHDEKKTAIIEKPIVPSQVAEELEVPAPGFVEESTVSSQAADELEIHTPGDDTGLNREDLRERIVSILQDHKDGMKMMHIAESLGIENWRSLIPIMRELLDEGVLAKDGSLYFG